eukprot:CAMPEP_0119049244 /NCGR_PEP_ID=MMETSP1177-20130426/63651_1 /TAXON_ID=2985 /ORGANISM="Ochromonas sp, Strain CCMP1899" /LENGTH=76 /DNA_ID=CAMNT_0007026231 /DNA_START=170 /DNA_END=400 /DNA_ORIENTATION=+
MRVRQSGLLLAIIMARFLRHRVMSVTSFFLSAWELFKRVSPYTSADEAWLENNKAARCRGEEEGKVLAANALETSL